MRHLSLLKGVSGLSSGVPTSLRGRALITAVLLTGSAAVHAQSVHSSARCEAPNSTPPPAEDKSWLFRITNGLWGGSK
eukprot:CAMPEP_0172046644 /NCGR_PEP_ID=MMETSP1043-20130122/550_1 /TAXON_ID=464988 /ORGANISM="Hemiselmis andersenii, Strain CCMP441" /LENGTH=77 /DNA_ID=CAMNT_0012705375 /DNA_START=84 /DNA_END=314 /DNA_ORIENTATION=+